jgi:aminoglycoside 6-adenylyltransferase
MSDLRDTYEINFLIDWGKQQDDVRAMILTGSLASPAPYVDAMSDYDVILILTDNLPRFERREWLSDFGTVLVAYRDPILPNEELQSWGYVVQYESGLRIDFTLWTVEMLQSLATMPELSAEFDAGYRVLMDKDSLTDSLKPPTHRGYIPKPPTEAEYLEKIENFLVDACGVAKYLWRDDLMAVKLVLDHYMKQEGLLQMLEWQLEIEHHWSVKPGPYGRRLKKWLRPDLWSALEATYTGADIASNWQTLERTIGLMQQVATEVGDSLGYAYPQAMHDRVMAYLQDIQNKN